MNLGNITEVNEQFLNRYKEYGYATKTQMADEAFTVLRRLKASERRGKWLSEAFAELAGTTRDEAFESLEGDDFVEGR